MAPIPEDPNMAQAWITGDPPDQTIDFYIPRGNQGVMGPTGPIGPSLAVGAIETVTGPAAPGTVGATGLTGAKGDPGGITLGTSLGTADLNNFTAAGVYRQGSSVPVGMNYPTTELGTLVVHQASANPWSIQEYLPQGGLSTKQAQVFYRRTYLLNVGWSSWKTYAATRVDQTAGRAIYQWDDLNSRDQLIYGDTGWRAITDDATIGVVAVGNFFGGANGTALPSDAVKIRRHGNRVYIGGNGPLQPKQDYSTTTRNVCLLPAGFRASGGNEFIISRYGNNGGDASQRLIMLSIPADYTPLASSHMTAVPLVDANWYNYATGGVWPKTYGGIWLWGSWLTNEAWPITLPGTAVGSIPNL